jgi:hypothetical protein
VNILQHGVVKVIVVAGVEELVADQRPDENLAHSCQILEEVVVAEYYAGS